MQTECTDAYNGATSLSKASPTVRTCAALPVPAATQNQEVVGQKHKATPSEILPEARTDRNVFLFLPNVVGYVRVLLLLSAIGFAEKGWKGFFLTTYAMSQLLDAIDGELARRYSQVSVFGACFDQLIDRLSTCVLYVLNAVAYPRAASVLIAVLLMDVGGHWLLYVSSTIAGACSHKQLEQTASPVLRLYYTSRPLMAATVVGYEAFFALLLVLRPHSLAAAAPFVASPLATAGVIMFWLAIPPMLFKVLTNVLQGLHGAKRLAKMPLGMKAD